MQSFTVLFMPRNFKLIMLQIYNVNILAIIHELRLHVEIVSKTINKFSTKA